MKRIVLLIVVLLVLVSCSHNDDLFKLIASEKTLPDNFNQVAFQREESPFYLYEVKMADNQTKYENAWSLYGLEKEEPTVNFKEKSVVFIGLTESGSCALEMDEVKQGSENNVMAIQLHTPPEMCTADASPRTLVIEIDHEIAKKLDTVFIVEDETQTAVPIEEPET